MGDVVKKVSLADVMEGWDDECFAYVKPATFDDRQAFRAMKADNLLGSEKFQRELVTSHFVSGEVKEFNLESKRFELVAMTQEHLDIGRVNDVVAMQIMGFDFDPKDLADLPPIGNQPSTSENPSTKTSSSEATPKTSPEK